MEKNREEIIIPLSITKNALVLLCAFGLIIGLIWFSQFPEHHNVSDLTIIVVGIIFFGYGGIRGLIRLYDGKPGLVINDKGIIDYYANNGLIEWEKITRIRIVRLSLQNTLSIEVHNLEDFYSNKSRWRRFGQKLSLIKAIQIPLGGLAYNSHELNEILQTRLENARHKEPY